MQDVIVTKPITIEKPPSSLQELKGLMAEMFDGSHHTATFVMSNSNGRYSLIAQGINVRGHYVLVNGQENKRHHPIFLTAYSRRDIIDLALVTLLDPGKAVKEHGLVSVHDHPRGRDEREDRFSLVHVDDRYDVTRPLVITVTNKDELLATLTRR